MTRYRYRGRSIPTPWTPSPAAASIAGSSGHHCYEKDHWVEERAVSGVPTVARVKAVQAEAEQDMDGSGRVLLRASGTEPLLRVMVEGESKRQVKRWAEHIADAVRVAAG